MRLLAIVLLSLVIPIAQAEGQDSGVVIRLVNSSSQSEASSAACFLCSVKMSTAHYSLARTRSDSLSAISPISIGRRSLYISSPSVNIDSVFGSSALFTLRGNTAQPWMGNSEHLDTVTRILVFNPSGRWSRSSHIRIGLVTGFLLGAATFAGAVVQSSSAHCRSQNGIPCGLGIGVLALPLMGGGAVVGGVIGALLPAAKWECVEAPPRT